MSDKDYIGVVDNFTNAVYALYDAAWILIRKYKFTPQKIMLLYRCTVRTWYNDIGLDEENDKVL